MGRRRTQQTARHCVKCRSHEHRHVERTLLARNPGVSGHVHPRVGIDSNMNQYELGRLSRREACVCSGNHSGRCASSGDSSRPSVLPVFVPSGARARLAWEFFGWRRRHVVVARRLLKYFVRGSNAPVGYCAVWRASARLVRLPDVHRRRVEEPSSRTVPAHRYSKPSSWWFRMLGFPGHTQPPVERDLSQSGKVAAVFRCVVNAFRLTVPCRDEGAPSHLRDRELRTLPMSTRP